MAEIKDLKTAIRGALAVLEPLSAHKSAKKGRKEGSAQYPDDEIAVDWIVSQIEKSKLAHSIHIRDGIKKFSIKGTDENGIYDRIRKKVRKKLKDGN